MQLWGLVKQLLSQSVQEQAGREVGHQLEGDKDTLTPTAQTGSHPVLVLVSALNDTGVLLMSGPSSWS